MMLTDFTAYSGGSNIGGSHYVYNGKVAVDYGAIQSGGEITYPMLTKADVELFLLSHDHLDHCGGLPLFANAHPHTQFFTTETAFHGARLQLNDSVNIASLQSEIDKLKGLKMKTLPFCGRDVYDLEKRVNIVKDTGWFEPIRGYNMSFRSAGHKPGAAMFLMVMPNGTRVLHACDISLDEQALVRGAGIPQDFLSPDILVVECTYGNREIPDRSKETARLVETVREVTDRGGKVVIPHFASTLGNVALPLAEAGLLTYIDGMGRSFMRLYENMSPWCEEDKCFTMDNLLYLVRNGRHRDELLEHPAPMVIITSSGMLQAGPSVLYTKELIDDPKNAIIIPGYQAEKTQGKKLLGAKKGGQFTFPFQRIRKDKYSDPYLDEWSETKPINAEIIPFNLSGHSSGSKVAEWVSYVNPKKVITVHGDPDSHIGFREKIRHFKKNIEVFHAINGETIVL